MNQCVAGGEISATPYAWLLRLRVLLAKGRSEDLLAICNFVPEPIFVAQLYLYLTSQADDVVHNAARGGLIRHVDLTAASTYKELE